MRHRVAMTDVAALMAGTEAEIEFTITAASRDGTDALKEDWRAQIVAAGLGNRLARTVRGLTFPTAGASLEAASFVWTKAPKIIDVYDRGALIRPTEARYLAIPTRKVPRMGRRLMSPVEVEAAFNQDLIIRPGRNGVLLAFVDAIAARNGRGVRVATKRRLAQGRVRKLVLMFTLVRSVRVQKRLDLDAIADRASARWPVLLFRRWATIPDRTARMKEF